MRRLAAAVLGLVPSLVFAYHPPANITRGIYLDVNPLLSSSYWAPYDAGCEFTTETAHGGRYSLKCVRAAGIGEGAGASQNVRFDQTTPAPLKISGWSKAEGASGAEKAWNYSIYADLRCADGSSIYMRIAPFSPGTHDWEYAEVIVDPEQPVVTAAVYVFLRQTTGTVYFDDLFVGPVDGPNLARNPGFEPEDRTNQEEQAAIYADLAALRVNAIHSYRPGTPAYWQGADGHGNQAIREFLGTARGQGLGVWLTISHPGLPGFQDANDPSFPRYNCVNGPWGEAWVEALGLAATYDFAGISLVPDEYTWLYYDLKDAYGKHPDPMVAEFYERLPVMCDCPVCRGLYRDHFGEQMPELPPGATFPEQSAAYRNYLRLRYDSTTNWLRRSANAVHAANPDILADSLICVSPICQDDWWGPGIAWDRLGETGMDFPTTDPYILLHNYLGDSTHWYVTETAAHLTAATPKRQCGIVLEASRLRTTDRELDPVEAYGGALSAVAHGAKELAWWHYSHITDQSRTSDRAPLYYGCVQGVYGLLRQADPWLGDLRPYQPVAVLYSRASDDWWHFYSDPEPASLLGLPTKDQRYAAVAQKEVLYYLFRRGVPTDLHYLESVTAAQLARYQAIVVPFPLAISDQQTALLERLAQSGKRLIVISRQGELDEAGAMRESPALRKLLDARSVTFLPDPAGYDLVSNRDNQKRTRKERIQPDPIATDRAQALDDALAAACGRPPWALERLVAGKDVEVAALANAEGDLVVLTTNWEKETVRCRLRLPAVGGPVLYGYRLGPDGGYVKSSARLTRAGQEYASELELKPQEACLWRLPAR